MIILIFGTRPCAIKLGPVAAALRVRRVPFRALSTNQHTELLDGTPAQTDLADSRSLGIPATGEIVRWLRQAELPVQDAARGASMIVVQGDTLSALAGARAGDFLGIPVAHVEAGVRSGDLHDPWPEESFRREITSLAAWHYAPTSTAAGHLLAEGVQSDTILVTGNPVVSAIARYSEAVPVPVPDLVILFTMHRREWRLGGMKSVLQGFHEAALTYPELELVWPMHPAVEAAVPPTWVKELPQNARVVGPMPYRPTLRLLVRSLGVATDSGGLQEEAAVLGVPCAVLRKVTDRPESVEAGVARVFTPDGDGVLAAIRTLRDRQLPRQVCGVYGTVAAADYIAAHLELLSTGRLGSSSAARAEIISS